MVLNPSEMNTLIAKIKKIIKRPMNTVFSRFFLITQCLLFVFISFAQRRSNIEQELNYWIQKSELEYSSIGVCLQNAGTGKILAQTNPQLSLVPGSVLKLVTTATALELLGPDFRFETKLAANGEIVNGNLLGDLIIIGGGDPVLGSEYFEEYDPKDHFLDEWVSALKEKNIRSVSGKIIVDASIYENQTIPNTWIWEDLGNYYGAGASGLSVYDNMYRIHLSSPPEAGKPTQIKRIDPDIPNIHFDNQVLSSNINRDRAFVFGSPNSNKRIIRGTIPKGKTDFVIKASMPDPSKLIKWQFEEKLAKSGIQLNSRKEIKQVEPYLICGTGSPKLIDIIKVINYESVNLFAEHLLKHLAFKKSGLGSTKEGVEVVKHFWRSKGINTDGFFMEDGSGLSRFNAMTAKQVVQILNYMKNQSKYSDLFFSSIPKVPDGTLYVFDPEKFPNGMLQAKSGSMTRVRCYAGLLKTTSNQEILFSILLNNFSCSQSKAIDLIEDFLSDIKRLPISE